MSYLICQWQNSTFTGICGKVFLDAETLHSHLTEVHVGRKKNGGICMTCFWSGCPHSGIFSKRDHIVSHLKTHCPLKTYACAVIFLFYRQVCRHTFKWQHDFNHHLKNSGHFAHYEKSSIKTMFTAKRRFVEL